MELLFDIKGKVINLSGGDRFQKILHLYQTKFENVFDILDKIGVSKFDIEFFKQSLFKNIIIGTTFNIQNNQKKIAITALSQPMSDSKYKLKLVAIKSIK